VREAGQPRTPRTVPRGAQFAADRIVVVEIERAQERLERQPLNHQRAEHHRELPSRGSAPDRETAEGSASAAASETMPRMPAHEMIKPLPTARPQQRPWRVESEPAVPPSDHGIERHVPRDAHNDHRHTTAPATRSSCPRWRVPGAPRIGRICRPMKMNAEDVQRKDRRLPDRRRSGCACARACWPARPRHGDA
jgi:hypothetical protein